jgi:hypothetical protein
MKTIKLIKLKIEEVPERYARPYMEVVEPKNPLKINFLTDETTLAWQEETYTRESYPLERFGYGRYQEPFYIKKGQLKLVEEMFQEFIKKAEKRAILTAQKIIKDGGDWKDVQQKFGVTSIELIEEGL